MTKTSNFPEQSVEKLPLHVVDDKKEGAKAVATIIADIIRGKQAQGKHAILGLATGSSPVSIYR
ncbi:MAG: hypothetical protein ACOCZI_02050, partial [Marinilabiliaceae bacterium]